MSTLMTLLLQSEIDLELGKPDGTTALYIACEMGYEEIVNQLLNAKANVEATHHRVSALRNHFKYRLIEYFSIVGIYTFVCSMLSWKRASGARASSFPCQC